MPALKRLMIAAPAALLLVAMLQSAAPGQQFVVPFVTIEAIPDGSGLDVGDHLSTAEMSNTRPVAEGAVGPMPIFEADDAYGCDYTTALASGETEWIAVAHRNSAVPDGLAESPCALFQMKVNAATAWGASALIIVNNAPGADVGTAAGPIPGVMIDQAEGNALLDAVDPADPDAVQVTLEPLDPDTLLPPGTLIPTSVDEVDTSVDGDTLSVTGKATFRGEAPVLVAEDFPGDGPVSPQHAHEAGVDLLGGYIYQPDPNDPTLVLEWQVSNLPASGSFPEAIRYGFPAKTATTDYMFQAKMSNLSSITIADDPEGHVEHVGASFQLRGNCGGFQGTNVGYCPHIAWLDGEFDTVDDAVRIRMPIGASFAPSIVPGAELIPNDASLGGNVVAAFQAVVSNETTEDRAPWDPGTVYTVPERTVRLGLVPAGSPFPQLTEDASVSGSRNFSGTIDIAGKSGDFDLLVEACFGTNCGTSRTPITL